ncbi:hypothetical protein F4780DRAFT_739207 [Xylariomycetidae sp. FL0641]|nr:hypothetical protein F4780DRAFT_739207 [Xylariomycetidae sp. FL0641]
MHSIRLGRIGLACALVARDSLTVKLTVVEAPHHANLATLRGLTARFGKSFHTSEPTIQASRTSIINRLMAHCFLGHRLRNADQHVGYATRFTISFGWRSDRLSL